VISEGSHDEFARTKTVDFKPRATRYAVVIPILNEGQTILLQLARMQNSSCPADIVLCDGDSQDGSTEVQRLAALGVRSILIVNERGLGTALRHGIRYAMEQGYEGVVTIDGNGKDGIEAIPRFLDLLDQGFDFVQGSRFLAGGKCENTPLDRYFGIRCFVSPLVSFASRFRFTDPTNGFKGLSRVLLCDPRMSLMRNELNSFNFQFYLNYRSPRLGFKVIEVPVSRVYPASGPTPTKITGLRHRVKLVAELLWTLAGFYNPPRRKS